MISLKKPSTSVAAPLSQAAQAAQVPYSITNQYDTPEYTPEEIQKQLQGQPINRFPGTMLDQAQGDATSRSSLPELPTTGLAMVPSEADIGPSPVVGEAQPIPAMDQRQDREEQGVRLALPTNIPNFAEPGVALDSLRQAEAQVAPSYDALGYRSHPKYEKKSQTNLDIADAAVEATAISNLANKMQRTVLDNEGAFANEQVLNALAKDMRLNDDPKSVNNIGSVMLLASARSASDILSRRYANMVDNPEGVPQEVSYDDPEFLNPVNLSKDPAERKQEYAAAMGDITSQPVLQGWINGLGNSISKLVSPPASPGGFRAEGAVSPLTASALAYNMYDQGFVDLGRDKHGRYYPILTKTGREMLAITNRAAAMYDTELRHLNVNEPIIRSQNLPPVNNRYAGVAALYSKDGRFITTENNKGEIVSSPNLIEAAAMIVSSTGIMVNPQNLHMLEQMYTDVNKSMQVYAPSNYPNVKIPNAFSTSVFAESIADLSQDFVVEKFKELIEQGVRPEDTVKIIMDISKNKLDQINKHLKDYLGGNLNKGARFTTVQISDATKRMFPTATDINTTNHSGTIRPGMWFAVQHKARVEANMLQQIGRLKDKARSIYNTSNMKGIAVGASIQRALYALPEEELAMMGALYQISKVAETMGYHKVPGNRAAPGEYIAAMTPDLLKRVAAFGQQAQGWLKNGFPTANDAVTLPPAFKSLSNLFEKKEWGPILSNSLMAADMLRASSEGGASVTMASTIETDASQSNAIIMSLLIGDLSVANMLGVPVGGRAFEELKFNFKDLRNKASSTIDMDVDDTFSGEFEQEKADKIKSMFARAKGELGGSFDKAYARGIVVAGLYGKHADYMFTEVKDMLAKLYSVVGPELQYIEEHLYKNNRQEFIEDLSSLYSTSTKRHLATLKGYQRAATGIAKVKAAVNGSTKVKGFMNTEVDLGIKHIVPYDDETNTVQDILGFKEDGFPLAGRANSLMAPGDYGKSQADISIAKERIKAINASIPDILDQLTDHATYGDKAGKALPVNLIQNGDANWLAIVLTFINKDNRDNKGQPRKEPRNILTVHDAGITDPSSTLLYINAFNNVAPHILAENSTPILDSLEQSMKEDIVRAHKEITSKGFADIGMNGKYKALSGYFDRIYNYSFGITREEQRGRIAADSAADKRIKANKEHSKFILDTAMGLGWLPPTERNFSARTHNRVTPKQWADLLTLMREDVGVVEMTHSKKFLTDAKYKYSHIKDKAGSLLNSLRGFKVSNATFTQMLRSMSNQITNTK